MYRASDYHRVCDLYKSDVTMSTRRVSELTGVNRQTVCDWIRAAGLTRSRNASREVPADKLDEAVEMYLSTDLSIKEVMRRTGVDRKAITVRVKALGLLRDRSYQQTRSQYKYSDAVCWQVGGLRGQGLTWRMVSEKTGVPMGSLNSLYKRYKALRRSEKYRRAA